MIEQELVDYITQAQKHGLTDFEIKQNLVNVGWDASAVEESFVFAKAAENRAAQEKTAQPQPAQYLPPAIQGAALTQSPQLSSSPSLTISDSQFQKPPKTSKPFFKNPVIIAGAAMLILAGGAFAYLSLAAPSAQKIWAGYTAAKKDPVYKIAFTISHSDQASSGANVSATSFSMGINGNSYIDYTDGQNPAASSTYNLDFKTNGMEQKQSGQSLLLDKVLYLNLGQMAAMAGQNSWIKIDFGALANLIKNKMPAGQSGQFENFLSIGSQIKDVWDKAQIVKVEKYLGKETVNGQSAYHLQNSLDKSALIAALAQTVNILNQQAANQTASGTPGQSLTNDQLAQINSAFTALLAKLNVKTFETWIGAKDSKLYRLLFVSSAPSASNLSSFSVMDLGPLGSASAKARDTQRLTDMRSFATALSLYNKGRGGYPEAVSGVPADLIPSYLPKIAAAPVPADGSCTDYYNTYWYTASGTPKTINGKKVYPSYSYTGCLGAGTGGFTAGIFQLTPSGMDAGIVCDGTPEQCQKPALDAFSTLNTQIGALNFGAELKLDISYSDYGKKEALTAPQDAMDILQLFSGFLGGAMNASSTQ